MGCMEIVRLSSSNSKMVLDIHINSTLTLEIKTVEITFSPKSAAASAFYEGKVSPESVHAFEADLKRDFGGLHHCHKTTAQRKRQRKRRRRVLLAIALKFEPEEQKAYIGTRKLEL